MFRMNRTSIEFLKSLHSEPMIPPLGSDRLDPDFDRRARKRPTDPLETAADYYEVMDELLEKGLIESGPKGFRLTEEGETFLEKLRTRSLHEENLG